MLDRTSGCPCFGLASFVDYDLAIILAVCLQPLYRIVVISSVLLEVRLAHFSLGRIHLLQKLANAGLVARFHEVVPACSRLDGVFES